MHKQGGSPPDALSVGFARARFGFGMAAAGIGAEITKVSGGRVVFPRKGGARLRATSGTLSESMGMVFSKVPSDEVVPDMGAAVARVSGRMEMEDVLGGLGTEPTLV